MATRIPIPTIQRQQRLTESLPLARAPMTAVEDNRGRALAAVGSVLGGVVNVLQRQELAEADRLQKEENLAWLSKASSDDQLKWMQTLAQRQDTAAAGAPDFTPQLLGEFDQYMDQAVQNAPERMRAAYRESLTRLRTNLGAQAVRFEADRKRDHLVSQYTEGAQADAAAIALNPALYDERRVFRMAAIEASELPADVKAKIVSGSESALAMAAGSTLATTQPRQTLAAMRAAAEGKPADSGYGWVSRLNADQILQLRNRAQAEIDRRENKAIIAQAARERQAAGALTAYTRQLALGIPPRAEDLEQWSTLLKGSEHEATFNRLQQGWGDVQALYSKPVAEQIAGLQIMQQRLQTEGGNVQDAGLLEFAQQGIAANVQMQTSDPLQWLERFADTPTEPLDLSKLGTPEGAANLQATLAQREYAIFALQQQNPGVPIVPALLKPQEAAQIVQAFSAGNAGERTQLLQSLVQMAGAENPARMENLLGQLQATGMPEADILVRVADIAAQEARITLSSPWIGADTVTTNTQVAATVLHGREILQANGKTRDGLQYKLPKDALIMAEIQSRIGAGYGSPVPGDSGYVDMLKDAEVIKGWYVGEAARRGNLGEDLDDDLLKYGVTAVVGERVDFHGNSTVFASRGMDEDQFVRHADLVIEEALKAKGLWTDRSDVSDFGLLSTGGNRYMLTLGDAPVGVTIQIDPNDVGLEGRAMEHQKEQRARDLQSRPNSILGW